MAASRPADFLGGGSVERRGRVGGGRAAGGATAGIGHQRVQRQRDQSGGDIWRGHGAGSGRARVRSPHSPIQSDAGSAGIFSRRTNQTQEPGLDEMGPCNPADLRQCTRL
eukprot:7450293-Pyramimonas_sp.AAC.1